MLRLRKTDQEIELLLRDALTDLVREGCFDIQGDFEVKIIRKTKGDSDV